MYIHKGADELGERIRLLGAWHVRLRLHGTNKQSPTQTRPDLCVFATRGETECMLTLHCPVLAWPLLAFAQTPALVPRPAASTFNVCRLADLEFCHWVCRTKFLLATLIKYIYHFSK